MDRCCALEFPEPLNRTRTRSFSQPRTAASIEFCASDKPPAFTTTAAAVLDVGASSFEESVAVLLGHLQKALNAQHEIFANHSDSKPVEQLQVLRHQGHDEAKPCQANGGSVPAHKFVGDDPSKEETAEHHMPEPSEKSFYVPVVKEKSNTVFDTGMTPVRSLSRETVDTGSHATVRFKGKVFQVPRKTSPEAEATVPHLLAHAGNKTKESATKHYARSASLLSRVSAGHFSMRKATKQFVGHQGSTRTSSSVRQLRLIQNIPKEIQDTLKSGRMQSGIFQSWTSSLTFDWAFRAFMNLVVLSNVIILGFQAGSDWIGWIFVDAFFVLVFAIELAYNVMNGGVFIFQWRYPDWRWNWFDLILLCMTTSELAWSFNAHQNHRPLSENKISKFTQLRMLRIGRILRILRLSHIEFFKDLGLMVVGTIGGLRTLLWSIVMILIPVYGVALFFTETLGTAEESPVTIHFATMRMSMFTTFRCLVLGDCSDADGRPIFPHVLEHYGWAYILVYCFAAVFMSFGLFNVIVAIYVESTVAAAKANEFLQRKRRLEDTDRLGCKLFELVHFIYEEFQLGPNAQHVDLETALAAEMTNDMFEEVIRNQTVRSILLECDVPEEDFSQLFDICDTDGGGLLSLDEILGGIRRMRGVPSRSDVVFVMLRIQEAQSEIHGLHVKLDRLLAEK